MANKFSFEASEQTKIIGTYQEALTEISTETNSFIDKVVVIAENTKYLPIVNLGKLCINFYNNEVKDGVENLFQNWIDSEASLKSFIENMEGGEEAINTAANLQQQLEDAIPDMFNVNDESILDTIDTSEPKIEEKDFDELKEITIQYKTNIEQIRNNTIGKIDNEKDDNAAYMSISAPVISTFGILTTSLESISQQFDTVKEEFNERQVQFSSAAEEVKSEAESLSQSRAEDALSNITVDFHL